MLVRSGHFKQLRDDLSLAPLPSWDVTLAADVCASPYRSSFNQIGPTL